jgi:GGDEF domain-containing protein
MTDREGEFRDDGIIIGRSRLVPLGDSEDDPVIHVVTGDEEAEGVRPTDLVLRMPEGVEYSAEQLVLAVMRLGKLATDSSGQVDVLLRLLEAAHVERSKAVEGRDRALGQVALLNALLERQAEEMAALEADSMIDTRTGLGSEKALRARKAQIDRDIEMDQAPEEPDRPRRGPMELTYVTLDLDGFKDANDATDWDTANLLLEILGRRLREGFRHYNDSLFRPYGDDAVIIMNGVSLDEEGQRSLRERVDLIAGEAYAEFANLLDDADLPEAAAAIRRMRLQGYSVGFAIYDRSRHGTAQALEADSVNDQHEQKRIRREAAGLPAAGRKTIID